MSDKKNGLYPGWPPFTVFKKEMFTLVDHAVEEKIKPMREDLTTVKESLVSHIQKTSNFMKKTDDNFQAVNNSLSEVKTALSNHVTETDKKIDSLKEDVKEIKNMLLSHK